MFGSPSVLKRPGGVKGTKRRKPKQGHARPVIPWAGLHLGQSGAKAVGAAGLSRPSEGPYWSLPRPGARPYWASPPCPVPPRPCPSPQAHGPPELSGDTAGTPRGSPTKSAPKTSSCSRGRLCSNSSAPTSMATQLRPGRRVRAATCCHALPPRRRP